MRHFCKSTFLLIASALTTATAEAAVNKSDINITRGPAQVTMEKIGTINLPAGYNFLDGKTTRALMQAEGEPVSGQEMGLITRTNEHWSVIFEFSDVGYVKDTDKDKLNPDKLLDAIKKGTAEANKERVKNGHPPLEIVGWEQAPKYDETTHNLEWAIRATSAGKPILNYNTRLLGRKGVMEVVLVVEPDLLTDTLPEFRDLLAGYTFQTGQTYAEFRPGDKVAKYGLAALVLGGAAVGAAKLGLLTPILLILKKAWKLVIIGVAAVATAIKKFFARIFGRKDETVQRQ